VSPLERLWLALIPEAIVQEIRDRADIVGLIGRYVELKQAGRNFKGLCPFHDEKTPSFNVNADRQIFHCFGCGAGGDVFGFLIKFENLSFPEAAHSLARELAIEIPQTGRGERSDSEGIYQALELAQACYHETLDSPAGEPGRDYLAARGIDRETIERFGIGFVPDRWDTVVQALQRADVSLTVAEKAGLVAPRSKSSGHYDRLRGRVTFPIFDVRGRVIAFGGRALSAEQEPKYLNTPETPVFHKRRSFYGFPQALEPVRRSERAVVCEGYFDAIALSRGGVGEAVATCGTALTADHAKQLRRRTAQVSLLFDGDEPGQKAMEKALLVLLPEGLRVRAVQLPKGMDPDDYLKERGGEALLALVDGAADALEVVIRRAMKRGCATPGEKADVVRHVAPMIAAISDPVERGEFARRLSVATSTDPAAVESIVRSAARGQSVAASEQVTKSLVKPRSSSKEDRHIRQLALIFLRHSNLATADLCDRMHEVLPESAWKRLIFRMLDAADAGLCEENGALDVIAMEAQAAESAALDADESTLLREIAFDDSLLESEIAPADVLVQILDHFVRKQRRSEAEDLTRRLQDPEADQFELLREKQAELERKRAASGVVPGPQPA